MKLIMTQRLREGGKGFDNVGGLYLNIDHISAVFLGDHKKCNTLLQDGTIFITAHDVGEILEMIREQNVRTLRTDVEAFCSAHDLQITYHHISDLLRVLE